MTTCCTPAVCEPGPLDPIFFYVAPPGLPCPQLVRQERVRASTRCDDIVSTYFVGTTTIPWTGPLAPVVAAPTPVVVCNTTTSSGYDRETQILCEPGTGTQVVVKIISDANAAPGTPPIIEAWNLDSSPYTGDVTSLVQCAAGDCQPLAARGVLSSWS